MEHIFFKFDWGSYSRGEWGEMCHFNLLKVTLKHDHDILKTKLCTDISGWGGSLGTITLDLLKK